MNRDDRTQPLLTVPFAPREPARVTEPLPKKTEPARPGTITETHLTQPIATEAFVTQPLPTVRLLPRPEATSQAPSTLTELAGELPQLSPPSLTEPVCETSQGSPPAPLIAAETAPLTEPASVALALEEPAHEAPVSEGPAAAEPQPAIRDPFDSEPLRELERLSAQIEQELRKSNPAYRPVPVQPEPPAEAAEEPLELYLERFMERVTGKKLDTPTTPAAPPVAATPSPVAPQAAPEPAARRTALPAKDLVPTTKHTERPAIASPAPPAAAALPPRESSRPPERREQLAAMRDLANESTRSAFAEHAGRKQWQEAHIAFMTAMAASIFSSLYAVWHMATGAPGAIQSAVCAGLLAALLACRFFLRCRQLCGTTRKN